MTSADSPSLQSKWDRIYRDRNESPEPSRVLAENDHLLPDSGTALDVACGLGSNALFLARRGFAVQAWDLSVEAIGRLRRRAVGLPIDAQVVDAEAIAWPKMAFDVIVVGRFLIRALVPVIEAALKPGGVLFYQTFVRAKVAPEGPRNPAYLLDENELLRLFPGLIVRVYREEAGCGDIRRGFRNEACLVGQRPEGEYNHVR
ncbi:class I SAM-dependent methyltransferase [Methylohalobius crimeensis]|uniref:class I SAM-dependent methyltransferase n=1 Tax=Methylohalobius crimeensis TaxID=244365 RepID=UPI0003B41E93|nr:class I SAM-dependent methyltransferase [Methylohalobius crimeensis]